MTTLQMRDADIIPDLDFVVAPYQQIADRLENLEDDAATTANIIAGLPGAEDAARATLEAATSSVGHAEERRNNGTGSDEEVAAAKQKRDRELARLNGLYAAHAPKRQAAAAAADVLAGVRRFLAGLRPSSSGPGKLFIGEDGVVAGPAPQPMPAAPAIEFYAPNITLPKSGRWADLVDVQRAQIAELRSEIRDTEAAPPTADYAKRRLRQIVADLGASGEPGVSGVEAGGRIGIRWPLKDIGAEPSRAGGGNTPRVIDAAAIACWLAPDKVLEVLDRDVDEALAGEPFTVDPHDKPRKIRTIKAKILDAERIEAAAVWAGREAGEDIAFRGDTDPRAVLGIA